MSGSVLIHCFMLICVIIQAQNVFNVKCICLIKMLCSSLSLKCTGQTLYSALTHDASYLRCLNMRLRLLKALFAL